jgi:hypothetical protein
MVLCQDGTTCAFRLLPKFIYWNSVEFNKKFCDHIGKRWNLRTRNNYNQLVGNRWASG